MEHTTSTTRSTSTTRTTRPGRVTRLVAGALAGTFAAGLAVANGGTAFAAPAPTTGTSATAGVVDVAAMITEFTNDIPLADFGSDTGADLDWLGIRLDEGSTYHYAVLGGGFTVSLPDILPDLGVDLTMLPDVIEVPAGDEFVIVVDPSDPFLYVGGPCPATPTDQRPGGSAADRAGDAAQSLGDLLGSGTAPIKVFEHGDEPDGPDCGFGFSANGRIPAAAVAGGTEFDGHLLIDGTFNVHPAVRVDGSIVARIDGSGVRAAGYGDATAYVPFIDSLVDISVPIGHAGIGLQADTSRIGVALDGNVDVPNRFDMPLFGTTVSFPVDAGIAAALRIGAVNNSGQWSLDPQSFLSVDGNLTIAGTSLADAGVKISPSGAFVHGDVDLGNLAVDVRGQITATNASLTGTATVNFPLSGLRPIRDSLVAGISVARRDLSTFGTQITNRRQVVRTERANTDRTLKNVVAALEQFRTELRVIDDNIATNNQLIRDRQADIRNQENWWNKASWVSRIRWGTWHLDRLARFNRDIIAYRAANAAQSALRPAAETALTEAAKVVTDVRNRLAAANVDDDWEIRRLKAARTNTERTLNQLEKDLRSLNLTGGLRGTIQVGVGTGRVTASLTAQSCTGSTCTTLAGGRVVIGNPTKACVTVFQTGEVCATL